LKLRHEDVCGRVTLDLGTSGFTSDVLTFTNDANGQAAFALTAGFQSGPGTLVASAVGAASAIPVTLVVDLIPTTTALAITATEGTTVTLVATVAANTDASAQGLVRFFDGDSERGAIRVDAAAQAGLDVAAGTTGHKITARFEGDDPFAPSVSSNVTIDLMPLFIAEGGAGCSGGGDDTLLGCLAALGLALVALRRRVRAR